MRRAFLLIGVAALLAGCGTGGKAESRADTATGQKLFTASCGGCHTLAAAGTAGTIGPNLDNAFAADRQQGIAQNTIQNVVLDQIRLGSGPVSSGTSNQAGTPMPANVVTGQDAQDVAAYVAAVAGQPGTTSAASPSQLGTNGKKIFQTECAGCHTLKDAGSTGTVGPNLDQLKPAEAIVQRQVTNGGAIMPPFKSKLSAAQISAVAKYVSSVAGK